MRALIVTNMYPSAASPVRGRFVRDQVEALQARGDLDLEVAAFTPGSAGAYGRAAADLRRRFDGQRFDIVHAHFGLTAWPARVVSATARAVTLHGTDLTHWRSRRITLAALPWLDLTAAVSTELAARVPAWSVRGREVAVLPCGVDTVRFEPLDRRLAREQLGLDPEGRYLLFPSDPRRPEKRHDRAAAVAGDVPLLTLGAVDPDEVPLYVNAANAVLVPSDREGFGLAVLEALACDVPVLATPCGIAPEALAGVAGTYCGPFEPARWREALAPHLRDPDPRIDGRERAQRWSAATMAERVATAWERLLTNTGPGG